jgi:hypothetical protein
MRFGDDRVADEIATHAGGVHIGRLEGQQRQHVIDQRRHLRRPPRPPGPDRGGDIVDGRQVGPRGAGDLQDAQAEIGAVDGNDDIGRASMMAAAVSRMRRLREK